MSLQQPTPSDAELMRRVAAGDELAFTTLFRRRQGAVYRFALQMSGSRAAAEDITQEVFTLLIREAARYDESRGAVAAFLYGIARNYVLRHLQASQSEPASLVEDAAEDVAGTADTLGDLVRNEAIETVRTAVLGLPAHYREVVVLCDLHELDYAEAAEALGCAVGTVRSRLHRGRRVLAERLRTVEKKGLAPGQVRAAGCVV